MTPANSLQPERQPSTGEEIASSVSHGAGLLAFLVACPLLIARAVEHAKPGGVLATSIFAAAIVLLYLASTIYHALPPGRAKRVFRIVEHGAIFLLIAGTYTPVTLLTLRDAWGRTLLVVVWSLAFLGIALQIFLTTKHRWLPGVLYLALAWLIVVAIRPLMLALPRAGVGWLLAGGVVYTIGMVFFAARWLPYGHLVWHLFVLAGTACHLIAVWAYIV